MAKICEENIVNEIKLKENIIDIEIGNVAGIEFKGLQVKASSILELIKYIQRSNDEKATMLYEYIIGNEISIDNKFKNDLSDYIELIDKEAKGIKKHYIDLLYLDYYENAIDKNNETLNGFIDELKNKIKNNNATFDEDIVDDIYFKERYKKGDKVISQKISQLTLVDIINSIQNYFEANPKISNEILSKEELEALMNHTEEEILGMKNDIIRIKALLLYNLFKKFQDNLNVLEDVDNILINEDSAKKIFDQLNNNILKKLNLEKERDLLQNTANEIELYQEQLFIKELFEKHSQLISAINKHREAVFFLSKLLKKITNNKNLKLDNNDITELEKLNDFDYLLSDEFNLNELTDRLKDKLDKDNLNKLKYNIEKLIEATKNTITLKKEIDDTTTKLYQRTGNKYNNIINYYKNFSLIQDQLGYNVSIAYSYNITKERIHSDLLERNTEAEKGDLNYNIYLIDTREKKTLTDIAFEKLNREKEYQIKFNGLSEDEAFLVALKRLDVNERFMIYEEMLKKGIKDKKILGIDGGSLNTYKSIREKIIEINDFIKKTRGIDDDFDNFGMLSTIDELSRINVISARDNNLKYDVLDEDGRILSSGNKSILNDTGIVYIPIGETAELLYNDNANMSDMVELKAFKHLFEGLNMAISDGKFYDTVDKTEISIKEAIGRVDMDLKRLEKEKFSNPNYNMLLKLSHLLQSLKDIEKIREYKLKNKNGDIENLRLITAIRYYKLFRKIYDIAKEGNTIILDAGNPLAVKVANRLINDGFRVILYQNLDVKEKEKFKPKLNLAITPNKNGNFLYVWGNKVENYLMEMSSAVVLIEANTQKSSLSNAVILAQKKNKTIIGIHNEDTAIDKTGKLWDDFEKLHLKEYKKYKKATSITRAMLIKDLDKEIKRLLNETGIDYFTLLFTNEKTRKLFGKFIYLNKNKFKNNKVIKRLINAHGIENITETEKEILNDNKFIDVMTTMIETLSNIVNNKKIKELNVNTHINLKYIKTNDNSLKDKTGAKIIELNEYLTYSEQFKSRVVSLLNDLYEKPQTITHEELLRLYKEYEEIKKQDNIVIIGNWKYVGDRYNGNIVRQNALVGKSGILYKLLKQDGKRIDVLLKDGNSIHWAIIDGDKYYKKPYPPKIKDKEGTFIFSDEKIEGKAFNEILSSIKSNLGIKQVRDMKYAIEDIEKNLNFLNRLFLHLNSFGIIKNYNFNENIYLGEEEFYAVYNSIEYNNIDELFEKIKNDFINELNFIFNNFQEETYNNYTIDDYIRILEGKDLTEREKLLRDKIKIYFTILPEDIKRDILTQNKSNLIFAINKLKNENRLASALEYKETGSNEIYLKKAESKAIAEINLSEGNMIETTSQDVADWLIGIGYIPFENDKGYVFHPFILEEFKDEDIDNNNFYNNYQKLQNFISILFNEKLNHKWITNNLLESTSEELLNLPEVAVSIQRLLRETGSNNKKVIASIFFSEELSREAIDIINEIERMNVAEDIPFSLNDFNEAYKTFMSIAETIDLKSKKEINIPIIKRIKELLLKVNNQHLDKVKEYERRLRIIKYEDATNYKYEFDPKAVLLLFNKFNEKDIDMRKSIMQYFKLKNNSRLGIITYKAGLNLLRKLYYDNYANNDLESLYDFAYPVVLNKDEIKNLRDEVKLIKGTTKLTEERLPQRLKFTIDAEQRIKFISDIDNLLYNQFPDLIDKLHYEGIDVTKIYFDLEDLYINKKSFPNFLNKAKAYLEAVIKDYEEKQKGITIETILEIVDEYKYSDIFNFNTIRNKLGIKGDITKDNLRRIDFKHLEELTSEIVLNDFDLVTRSILVNKLIRNGALLKSKIKVDFIEDLDIAEESIIYVIQKFQKISNDEIKNFLIDAFTKDVGKLRQIRFFIKNKRALLKALEDQSLTANHRAYLNKMLNVVQEIINVHEEVEKQVNKELNFFSKYVFLESNEEQLFKVLKGTLDMLDNAWWNLGLKTTNNHTEIISTLKHNIKEIIIASASMPDNSIHRIFESLKEYLETEYGINTNASESKAIDLVLEKLLNKKPKENIKVVINLTYSTENEMAIALSELLLSPTNEAVIYDIANQQTRLDLMKNANLETILAQDGEKINQFLEILSNVYTNDDAQIIKKLKALSVGKIYETLNIEKAQIYDEAKSIFVRERVLSPGEWDKLKNVFLSRIIDVMGIEFDVDTMNRIDSEIATIINNLNASIDNIIIEIDRIAFNSTLLTNLKNEERNRLAKLKRLINSSLRDELISELSEWMRNITGKRLLEEELITAFTNEDLREANVSPNTILEIVLSNIEYDEGFNVLGIRETLSAKELSDKVIKILATRYAYSDYMEVHKLPENIDEIIDILSNYTDTHPEISYVIDRFIELRSDAISDPIKSKQLNKLVSKLIQAKEKYLQINFDRQKEMVKSNESEKDLVAFTKVYGSLLDSEVVEKTEEGYYLNQDKKKELIKIINDIEKATNNKDKIIRLSELFNVLGLDIEVETLEKLAYRRLRYNGRLTTILSALTEENDSLINNIETFLNKIDGRKLYENEAYITTRNGFNYQAFNLFKDIVLFNEDINFEGGVMEFLGKKKIFPYEMPMPIDFIFDRIKNDLGYQKQMELDPFTKHSLFMKLMQKYKNDFDFYIMASDAIIKNNTAKDYDKMTEEELNELMFALWEKFEESEELLTEQIEGMPIDGFTYYLVPALSDRIVHIVFRAPVFAFNENYHYKVENNKISLTEVGSKMIYNAILKKELSRMIHFYKNIDKINVKGYDKVAGAFLSLPQLNTMKVKIETADGILTQSLITYIAELIYTEQNRPNDEILDIIENTLFDNTNFYELIDKAITNFKVGGIEYSEWNNNENVFREDKGKFKMFINYLINNGEFFALIGKDIAHYGKKEIFNFKEIWSKLQNDERLNDIPENAKEVKRVLSAVRDTIDNARKRLIWVRSPFIKTPSHSYAKDLFIPMKDRTKKVERFEYVLNLFIKDTNTINALQSVGEDNNIIYNKLKDDTLSAGEKKNIIKDLTDKLSKEKNTNNINYTKAIEYLTNLLDYIEIDNTDAQMYVGYRTWLKKEYEYGRISRDIYLEETKRYTKWIKKGRKGKFKLAKEIKIKILKPIVAGHRFDNNTNQMIPVMIKMAELPLIPGLVEDSTLEKIRDDIEMLEDENMENGELTKGVFASYSSANKVGQTNRTIDYYSGETLEQTNDPNRISNRDIIMEVERTWYGVQQEPKTTHEYKHKQPSQLAKTIFAELMDYQLDKPININGRNISNISELYEVYNNLFENILKTLYDKTFNTLTYDPQTKTATYDFDLRRLFDDMKRKMDWLENSEILNKFKLNNNNKIDDILMGQVLTIFEALVKSSANKMLSLDYYGNLFILTTPNDIDFERLSDISDRMNILWIENSLNNLSDGEEPILIPARFPSATGEIIELIDDKGNFKQEFVEEKNGKLFLKDNLISEEILGNMIATRIPTSGQGSSNKARIVGFLPPNTKDIAITRDRVVATKGLDFDYDKETGTMLAVQEIEEEFINNNTGLPEKRKKIVPVTEDNKFIAWVFGEHFEEIVLKLNSKFNKLLNNQNKTPQLIEQFLEDNYEDFVTLQFLSDNIPGQINSNSYALLRTTLIQMLDNFYSQFEINGVNYARLNNYPAPKSYLDYEYASALNNITKIMASILGDNNPEIQRLRLAPINFHYLEALLEKIEKQDKLKPPKGYSILNPFLQNQTKYQGSVGKQLVATEAIELTLNSSINVVNNASKKVNNRPAIKTSRDLDVEIFGKLIREAEVYPDLNNIGGNILKKVKNILQGSLDNDKLGILGKVGITNENIFILNTLSSLGIEEVEGLDLPVAIKLMRSPIVQKMNMQKHILPKNKIDIKMLNRIDDIMKTIEEKYANLKDIEHLIKELKEGRVAKLDENNDVHILINFISFLYHYDAELKAMNTIVNAISSKGVNDFSHIAFIMTFLDMLSGNNNLFGVRVEDTFIEGMAELIGDITYRHPINTNGWTEIDTLNGKVWIQPKTMIGHQIVNALKISSEIIKTYDKLFYSNTFKALIGDLWNRKYNRDWNMLRKSIKEAQEIIEKATEYMVEKQIVIDTLFDGDIDAPITKNKLNKIKENKNRVTKEIYFYIKKLQRNKNNPLKDNIIFKHLRLVKQRNGYSVELDISILDKYSDEAIKIALIEMYQEIELPQWNYKQYTSKDLIIDIILNNIYQNKFGIVSNITGHLPNTILEDIGLTGIYNNILNTQNINRITGFASPSERNIKESEIKEKIKRGQSVNWNDLSLFTLGEITDRILFSFDTKFAQSVYEKNISEVIPVNDIINALNRFIENNERLKQEDSNLVNIIKDQLSNLKIKSVKTNNNANIDQDTNYALSYLEEHPVRVDNTIYVSIIKEKPDQDVPYFTELINQILISGIMDYVKSYVDENGVIKKKSIEPINKLVKQFHMSKNITGIYNFYEYLENMILFKYEKLNDGTKIPYIKDNHFITLNALLTEAYNKPAENIGGMIIFEDLKCII